MIHRSVLGVAVLLGLAGVAEAASWQVRRSEDPFTDERIVLALLEPVSGVGIAGRCTGGTRLEAYAGFPAYVDRDASYVRYRIDRGPVEAGSWATGTEGTAVFSDRPARFLRQLQEGSSIIIESVDYNGTPYQLKLSLAGSRAAISQVLAACGNPANEALRSQDPELPVIALGVVTSPAWIRKPDGEDIAAVMPAAAAEFHGRGQATMECSVTLGGRLEACSVVSETPPGIGFGLALLRLAPTYRMRPQNPDGSPVAGSTVRVSETFLDPPAP